MGDANEQSLYEIWHGESFSSLRNAFKQQTALKNYAACNLCTDNVLTEERSIKINGRELQVGKFKGILDVVEDGQVVSQSGRRPKAFVSSPSGDE